MCPHKLEHFFESPIRLLVFLDGRNFLNVLKEEDIYFSTKTLYKIIEKYIKKRNRRIIDVKIIFYMSYSVPEWLRQQLNEFGIIIKEFPIKDVDAIMGYEISNIINQYREDNLDLEVIICTHDGDFSPIVKSLKRQGINVSILGLKSKISKRLCEIGTIIPYIPKFFLTLLSYKNKNLIYHGESRISSQTYL
ncbi:MAG: NYN domain-containing protein [Candidatus Helarchaeota archaeon]